MKNTNIKYRKKCSCCKKYFGVRQSTPSSREYCYECKKDDEPEC